MTFKQVDISRDAALLDAAKRRIRDEAELVLPERQVDVLARNYLAAKNWRTVPALRRGKVLESNTMREFLKDAKFQVNYLASEVNRITATIQRDVEDVRRSNRSIETDAAGISAAISQEEIRIVGKYTKVQCNKFARAVDFGLGYGSGSFLVDYKTGFTFHPENLAQVVPNTGITLPVQAYTKASVRSVYLDKDGTDFGDSKSPIISTDPRSVLVNGKSFRQVIIKREFDKYGIQYPVSDALLMLCFTLSTLQMVNCIRITPAGGAPFKVDYISYFDGTNGWVDIGEDNFVVDNEYNILLPPVRATAIRITLSQSSPIAKTSYNANGVREAVLDSVLKGIGFKPMFDLEDDVIEGTVYDFSIASIEIGLNRYRALGVYRSNPLYINKPISMDMYADYTVGYSDASISPEANSSLPPWALSAEAYIGMELKENGGSAIADLIPVPLQNRYQSEILPLIGTEARTKFMPDLSADYLVYQIASTTTGETDLVVDLSVEHFHQVGEKVYLALPPEGGTSGYGYVTAVTDTSISIGLDNCTFTLSDDIDASTLPRAYLYVIGEASGFFVGRGNDYLSVGADYTYSLDGGATWLDTFQLPDNYWQARESARASDFRIRFKNPRYDSLHWIEYVALKNQSLGNTNLVRLVSNKIVLENSLFNATGTLTSVFIVRAGSLDPHVTPLVSMYYLAVNEDES